MSNLFDSIKAYKKVHLRNKYICEMMNDEREQYYASMGFSAEELTGDGHPVQYYCKDVLTLRKTKAESRIAGGQTAGGAEEQDCIPSAIGPEVPDSVLYDRPDYIPITFLTSEEDLCFLNTKEPVPDELHPNKRACLRSSAKKNM